MQLQLPQPIGTSRASGVRILSGRPAWRKLHAQLLSSTGQQFDSLGSYVESERKGIGFFHGRLDLEAQSGFRDRDGADL